VEVLGACAEAGVEIVMMTHPADPKLVTYFEKSGDREKVHVIRSIPYPYEYCEKICKEHSCDPERGYLFIHKKSP